MIVTMTRRKLDLFNISVLQKGFAGNHSYMLIFVCSFIRLMPFERFSQLCKLRCCLEDNARLFPKLRKYL